MLFNTYFIVLGIFMVTTALYTAVSSLWHAKGYRRLLGFLGGIVMTYGIGAFCACCASSGLNLPPSFEWPMGRADQLIEIPDGRRVAVNPATSRIQVYDRDWKFVRSWVVNASGGTFRARLLPDDKLEVWTARGSLRYVFTLDGDVAESGSYRPANYMSLPATAGPGDVPTPLWLWPFSSPFTAWGVGVAGGILLACSGQQRFSRRKKSGGINLLLALRLLFFVVVVGTMHSTTIHRPQTSPSTSPAPAPPTAASATPSPPATASPTASPRQPPTLHPRGDAILKTQTDVKTQYGILREPIGTRVHLLGEHDGKWTAECSAGRLEVSSQDLMPAE